MNIQLTILLLLFNCFVFAQTDQDYVKADSIFNRGQIKYDSLGLNSVRYNEQLDKIENMEIFTNKLLYEDNYKSKEKISEIVAEFRDFIPQNIKYNIFYNDKKLLVKSMKHLIFVEKCELHKMRRNEIENYYKQLIAIQKERINKIDNRIIYLLTKEKISMEDYNKMSEEEKNKLFDKLNNKYK